MYHLLSKTNQHITRCMHNCFKIIKNHIRCLNEKNKIINNLNTRCFNNFFITFLTICFLNVIMKGTNDVLSVFGSTCFDMISHFYLYRINNGNIIMNNHKYLAPILFVQSLLEILLFLKKKQL